jgi:hypothetical protein
MYLDEHLIRTFTSLFRGHGNASTNAFVSVNYIQYELETGVSLNVQKKVPLIFPEIFTKMFTECSLNVP